MAKFLKIINHDDIELVSEPWCNDEGVAVLPYIFLFNEYWFLLINENKFFNDDENKKYYGTLTGGCEKIKTIEQTVQDEVFEETGLIISGNHNIVIYNLGTYFANKSSIKKWHLFAVDITALNLDIKKIYYGQGDGSESEKGISGTFINENQLSNINDSLGLAIYGKMHLNKIFEK